MVPLTFHGGVDEISGNKILSTRFELRLKKCGEGYTKAKGESVTRPIHVAPGGQISDHIARDWVEEFIRGDRER